MKYWMIPLLMFILVSVHAQYFIKLDTVLMQLNIDKEKCNYLPMQENKETWADCINCKSFFIEEDKQACRRYDLVGLPDKCMTETNHKCCSSFSHHKIINRMPNTSKMEEGVLYFYHSNHPNTLIEDMDL